MHSEDTHGQASWLLVEALGLPEGTVPPGLAVDDAQWAKLVDTARAQRFGELPLGEGFHRVGLELGHALAESQVGLALQASLESMSAERAWTHVIPHLALRLRQPREAHVEPTGPTSARLTVTGHHAVDPRMTLGIFEVAGELTRPPSKVTLVESSEELMAFEVSWG